MKYEDTMAAALIFVIIFTLCIGGALITNKLAQAVSKTPDPALAPSEASKQLSSNAAYDVYEFTDPVTYKRYLVFRATQCISVVEAPRPVIPLEKK